MNSSRLVIFLLLAIVSAARADVFNMPTGQTSLQLVTVGNPGNANDPNTGNLYGGVPYNYSLGKYDVTVGQYTAFLNAVAKADPHSLYNPLMATYLNIAGIARNGPYGSYTYSVIGSPNHPITFVSWGDAARFANWLSNGQQTYDRTTEDGSYFLNDATANIDLKNVARKGTATWVIPTESEWYKAAYYNTANGSYYLLPFGNEFVGHSAPPGSIPNTGNFISGNGNYAVTGSANYDPNQNYLTDVGAYTASASPYGAYDIGGNVIQWTETFVGEDARRIRGDS
jgi:formylglycine-generating enzyme required for sulfatase activity